MCTQDSVADLIQQIVEFQIVGNSQDTPMGRGQMLQEPGAPRPAVGATGVRRVLQCTEQSRSQPLPLLWS